MRISISVIKFQKPTNEKDAWSAKWSAIKDQSNFLISAEAYWLSRDVIFCNDRLTGSSNIQEADRSAGRVCIANNDSICVYVVFVENSLSRLVGVLRSKDAIIFDLPISLDDDSIEEAKNNGFEITNNREDAYYKLNPDIIDATYHNGRSRYAGDGSEVSYEKHLSDLLSQIDINYAEGAEI